MLTEPAFMYSKSIIIFPRDGEKISFQNDNLVVTDKDGAVKFQCTCYKLFLVYIVGGFSMTSGLIEKSNKFGFSIVLLSTSFRIISSIPFKTEGNVLLREKQYSYQEPIEIARHIVMNKIDNQINMLAKLRDTKDDGIALLKEHKAKLQEESIDLNTIMGHEGIAAKVYFPRIFKNSNWKGRQPRVKRDVVNVLLDIGYTVLFNYVEALLNLYGFDVYKGNLHQVFYRRKSLVCDMVEPFRPIIDYAVKKMLGLKQICENDFSNTKDGRFNLEWKQSAKVVGIFVNSITEYRQRMFQYFQQYYRWFMKGGNIKTIPKVVIE